MAGLGGGGVGGLLSFFEQEIIVIKKKTAIVFIRNLTLLEINFEYFDIK
jgi:hypothetical protein